MKLSKILLFITTVLSALILTGCSDELTKLTSSEQSAVVSYSAHVVSLYNVNQKKGYVKLSDEYLKSVEKKEADGDGTITSSLGAASLQAGLIAGAVGLLLIAVFVFAYYRVFGFISLITLITGGALVYGMLVLLGRWVGYSLDLSGVAGLIIGIGAAADSFVVLYERIKDEVREGRTFRSAAHRGWDRAKRTIVTGNMVTLIGAVVIYFLAVGEVRGFAFTLGLTTVFDLLVTFLVTAPLMLLAAKRRFFAKPSVNGMGQVFELAAERRAQAGVGETPLAEEPVTVGSGGATAGDTPTTENSEEK